MANGQSFWRGGILAGALALAGLGAAQAPENRMEIISVEDLPVMGPYSQAVIANGFLFASGVIAMDPDTGKLVEPDINKQTRQVFENIKAVLQAGGATLSDVVKVSVFLKNPADFPAMNEVYASYFIHHKPARTTVPGAVWGPGVLIEIEVIALVK